MGAFTQPGIDYRSRAWRFGLFVVTAVVTALSVAEFVNLLANHMIGAEAYGLLVAAFSAAAGIASLALLMSPRRHLFVLIGILILWTIVAFGGIAGSIAHVVGPDPVHGPFDTRPRPAAAPLVFTLYGVVGASVLFLGQRRKPDV